MKMNGSRSFRIVLFVAVHFLFSSPANAGVVKRSIRMVREVYPPDIEPENEGNQAQVCIVGDVVYGADETVPAEQPCLKCRCQPPGVQCETVQCAKKPGCKAIHRPNKCCPDYQCECEHNGKIYANGEKLETNPGGECKVCYCRGGELQCAEVSCYIRNDCEGKRVPGTCCPKYDHCPPIDIDRASAVTEPSTNTLKPTILWQETNITEVPGLATIPEDSNKVPDTSELATEPPSFEEVPEKEEVEHPRITIQEIIPERKEIPITAPPKIFISEPQGTLLIEESLPTSENTSNDLNIDSEPESSEVSEVFQHPPPVLRIGDKLLFLKKGDLVPEKDTTTADSIITIIGAEGLQRGGVEESLEVHEVHDVQPIKSEETILNNTNDGLESIYEPSNLTKEVEGETNDLELKPAESTHILSLVKRKDKTITSTSTQAPTTQKEDVLTTQTSSIEEPRRSESQHQVTESNVESEITTADIATTILPTTEARTEIQIKNIEPVVEQNPAYPPIPDIMPAVGDISQKFEVELENDNATTMEIKILPEVFDFLSNSTKNQTVNSHSEWLKSSNNESLVDFKAGKLPDELLNERSPIDEAEEETSTIQTTTEDFNLLKEIITKDPDVESLETTTEQQIKSAEEEKLLKEGAQLIAEVKILDESFKESSEPISKTEEEIPQPELTPKSIESIEIDSGEQTTPKSANHSSIISNENASVETQKEGKLASESHDMTKPSAKEVSIELGSVEISDNSSESSIPKDVEMIASVPSTTQTTAVTKENIMKQDVEIINLPKPTKLAKIETSTYELLPTPEEAKSKTIIKREINSADEDVFKDLEKELNADSTQSSKTPEEERSEADQIFKELLEEGNDKEAKPKTKEQEKVDNLTDALAGIALKGKLPDANVLRLLGGLLGGQRK